MRYFTTLQLLEKDASERSLSGQTLGWTNRDRIARCIFDLQDKREHARDKSVKSFACEFRTYSISHTIRRFVNGGILKICSGRGCLMLAFANVRVHSPTHRHLIWMDRIFHIGFESEGLNSGLVQCARSTSYTIVRILHSFRTPPPVYPSRKTMVNARENGKIDCAVGSEAYHFTTWRTLTLR